MLWEANWKVKKLFHGIPCLSRQGCNLRQGHQSTPQKWVQGMTRDDKLVTSGDFWWWLSVLVTLLILFLGPRRQLRFILLLCVLSFAVASRSACRVSWRHEVHSSPRFCISKGMFLSMFQSLFLLLSTLSLSLFLSLTSITFLGHELVPGSLSDIRILRRLVLPVRRDLEERSFAKESFEDIKNRYI